MAQSITDEELAALIRRTEEANAAFMRGDMRRYATLTLHSDDYTLMAPFGGAPTRGFDDSSERLAELGRYFRAGTSALEVVQSYASGDLVVLAVIERQRGEVGGLPAQDWSLRVTLVFRREVGAPARRSARQQHQPGAGGRDRSRLTIPSLRLRRRAALIRVGKWPTA